MKTLFVRNSAPGFSFPPAWRDFDRLFDQVLQRTERDPALVDQASAEQGEALPPSWRAAASLWEEEGRYLFEMEVPGVAPEDIDVTVNHGVLSVSADKKTPAEQHEYKHQERGFGKIERSVALPEEIDPDSIEAKVEHGVLHVTLAKRPEDQPRRIEVKSK